MSLVGWTIIILLIIIGVFVFLWLNGVFRPPSALTNQLSKSQIEDLLQQSSEQSGWNEGSDVPGGTRNKCLVYTFPGIAPTQPGVPTYDTEVLDGITPTQTASQGCIDPDQVAAQQRIRTCIGGGFNSENTCLDSEGNVFTKGEQQIYYQPCNIQTCQNDQYGLIALNFDPENFTQISGCLEADLSDPQKDITVEPCDLTKQGQLFRMTTAATGTLEPNSTGPYAEIFQRDVGLCFVPKEKSTTLPPRFKLDKCDPNNGFIWFLAPPLLLPGETNPSAQQIILQTNPNIDASSSALIPILTSSETLTISAPGTPVTPGQPLTAPSFGQPATLVNVETVVPSRPDNLVNGQLIDLEIFDTITTTVNQFFNDTGTNFPFYTLSTG